MTRTDRHTALDWAGQIELERLTCQRGTSWHELDAAIREHLTHAPGSLADCGTESLCDQQFMPTRPAELDEPTEDGPGPLWLLAVVAVIALSASSLDSISSRPSSATRSVPNRSTLNEAITVP